MSMDRGSKENGGWCNLNAWTKIENLKQEVGLIKLAESEKIITLVRGEAYGE